MMDWQAEKAKRLWEWVCWMDTLENTVEIRKLSPKTRVSDCSHDVNRWLLAQGFSNQNQIKANVYRVRIGSPALLGHGFDLVDLLDEMRQRWMKERAR